MPTFVSILEDTLYITLPFKQGIYRYLTDGTWVDFIAMNGKQVPQFPKKVGNDKTVGYVTVVDQTTSSFSFNLSIIDKKFNNFIDLTDKKINLSEMQNLNVMDFLVPFACGDDKIYVGQSDENSFKIKVFDKTGNELAVMEKPYRKIKLSDVEKEDFINSLLKLNPQQTVQNMPISFKKSINAIFVDNKGRVLAQESIERTKENMDLLSFAVFENGKYIGNETATFKKGRDFFDVQDITKFIGDRVYTINMDGTINIFKIVN
ncbi:MAG: hypothetical protein JXR48_03535 [Candidatus Delongbacteria bacterium]|nr:hypothetical protein [Candidatus Delongbacteria bacterium]MBN2834019.1 hypothetical protein [Candidatus Delongbacteria bacterium]